MADLSHWDYVENFTGQEAAALILGLDPVADNLAITAPLLGRMNDAYNRTLRAHQSVAWWQSPEHAGSEFLTIGAEDEPFAPTNLHSWRMTAFYGETPDSDDEGRLKEGLYELAENRFQRWLHDDLRSGFDHQLFEPFELYRWTDALGFRTAYRFMGHADEPATSLQPANRILHSTAERRDLLTPAIEHAQTLCRNTWDASEVWGKLRTLANMKHSPLIGMDEVGIQYLDANDKLKNISLKALRMRLARAR